MSRKMIKNNKNNNFEILKNEKNSTIFQYDSRLMNLDFNNVINKFSTSSFTYNKRTHSRKFEKNNQLLSQRRNVNISIISNPQKKNRIVKIMTN